MRHFFALCFLFFCPLFVQAEVVRTASLTYDVQSSGVVQVTEEITYDFGSEERHGICRVIDTSHAERASVWYKNRLVELSVLSVSRNGAEEPYELSGIRSKEIKVGDEDVTITGVHTYRIVYELRGALSYFADGSAELYWNVTGNDWEVSLENVSWSLGGVPLGGARCYLPERECALTSVADRYGTVVDTIAPGEELTIAVAFPPGAVEELIIEELQTVLFLLIAIALVFGITITAIVRFHGYYHKRRPIIAQYEPYAGVEPMFAGTLIDDALNPRDIAAGIVYLAEQGFITIKRTERKVVWLFDVTDYEVTIKRPIAELESAFLKTVLGLIFVDMSVGQTMALSALKRDTSKQVENAKTIAELQSNLRADLVARGFMESTPISYVSYVAVAVFVVFIVMPGILIDLLSGVVYGSLLAIVIGLIVYGLGTMRRRTVLGHEAKYHLRGFKEFLSVTDKERFDFHNAPERSPEQFMSFLPYAIAFGVEEKWAKVFADMQITTPSWYDGQGGTFVATAFAHDIAAFSSSVTESASASSGGGSAGGGGGGGGGGSW